ncbi:tenascin-N isoform X6 [Solea senegalensis]|uniref:Tenascin-N isoform X6 n=1 Tax=Solea senegalensis TaxID=28829 RepID=A0AAV6T5R3_SOLSE|nr:tenascin-N isoform X4 [Solea senegalensis]KAG7524888.1 tenascin-N isoform X6 [Solea senegalensis]
MTTRLLWRALCLLALHCTISLFSYADNLSEASEQGVTFSHVYKIDIPGSSNCKVEQLPTQDDTGLQTDPSAKGENDIVFRHNIRLQTPKCDCAESESFLSLLYRVNGLEEEVNYLKTQCAQGLCGKSCAAGADTSCSGHGIYQHDTCSCLCYPGWEGPDCSVSSCPDECNDNGRCVGGKCVCHQGYAGDDCSQITCPDNCNDKGHCVDGKCVCFPHFTGEDCSIPKCPNDCIGNGQCVNGQCICDEGFYGEDCSLVFGPQGLRVVQVTDVSLLVEWKSVRGAEYYVLTYHPKGDTSASELVRIPNTENSHLITGLTPGVTYIAQVYAVIKEIQSEADKIEATTGVSAIDDVQVLGQTEVSIQVDWRNPPGDVDHFRLTHMDPEGQEEELNVQSSQEARTKHTIVGLYPGTEYLISVQAIKGTTEGKPSSITGATDFDAPTNLITTEVTEDTVTVSWDRVQAEIEGYMLSYTSAAGSSSEIFVGRDSTSYRLIGLKPGVLHKVYIWAFKGDKVSRKSSTEAETDIDAPKDLKATGVQVESALLTWIAPLADIDGYILTYRDEDGNMESVETQLRASESTFAVSSLETGKRYIVSIIAYRGNKRSKVAETLFKTVGVLYPFPMDCMQIMKNGNKKSGIYTVYINNDRSKPVEAYCDMDTDGGGWLVLQRRTTGKLDFMKRWRQYIAGFGNMTDEFWIGLDKIYELTNTPTQYEVRFDLGLGSERAYAVYDNFRIASVRQKFKLTIGKYSGTAGDAMTYHQDRSWTTIDSDNDLALGNCALTHRGAWWYKNCHLANLNGKWGDNRHSLGVNWEPWKGHLTTLDFTEMKIRPVGALSSRKRRSLLAREKSRSMNLKKN